MGLNGWGIYDYGWGDIMGGAFMGKMDGAIIFSGYA